MHNWGEPEPHTSWGEPEPHTRELGGEISVCVLVCLYPSDFARELEVKCSRGQVRITADSKSRSRRFDTGK